MSDQRFFSLPVLLFLIATLAACASAGPDLRGPQGPALMDAYSGSWVLDPARSDDLSQEMRKAMEEGAGGMSGRAGGGGMTGRGDMGGRRGGGGGGMRPGGGMGGMGGASMDPEAMRQMMEALRGLSRTPERLSLNLQPEAVTLTQNGTQVLDLSLSGEEQEIRIGEVTLVGRAKWTSDGIEIDQMGQRGHGVRDRLQVNQEGDLVLKREISLASRSVKGTLVYVRESDPR